MMHYAAFQRWMMQVLLFQRWMMQRASVSALDDAAQGAVRRVAAGRDRRGAE